MSKCMYESTRACGTRAKVWSRFYTGIHGAGGLKFRYSDQLVPQAPPQNGRANRRIELKMTFMVASYRFWTIGMGRMGLEGCHLSWIWLVILIVSVLFG